MKSSIGGFVGSVSRFGAEPSDVATADRHQPSAWNLARTILVVVFCASGLVALLEVWQSEHDAARTGVAGALMVALLAIQLLHFSRPNADLRSPLSYVLLVVLAALAYAPLPEFGLAWISLPPFLAGCLLLVLPPAAAWSSFAGVLGSVVWLRIAAGDPSSAVAYGAIDAAFFGMVVYLLTRLASLVGELDAARDDIARMAVAEERLRFARDLHDLLGLSLSAISLKCELTQRLVARDPDRARGELGEILGIARQALGDVRSVASGYRELSLEQEAASAESLLRASDVDVRLHLGYTHLPAHVRTILGMVLREGVTNVLRHSTAERCEISIRQSAGQATLDIVNDGVAAVPPEPDPDPDPDSGNGLRNLADRVAALHGEIVARVRPDGRFGLHARVPAVVSRGRRGGPDAPTATLPLDARTAMILVSVAFSAIAAGAVVHLWTVNGDVAARVSGTCYLAALLVLQLAYFSRPNVRLRAPSSYLLLAAQACLIYLPLLQLGGDWVSIPGWLGSSALLLLGPLRGSAVFAATVGSVVWMHVATGGGAQDITFYTASTVITGLIAYGLTSLTKLVAELDATRKKLATMAVAEERLRFARDLHDLLGLSLSAITLKCELTTRLLGKAPDRATVELTEILTLARRALADVRSVAGGCRELPLDQESRSAELVLTAADVEVRTELDHGELPVRVRTVLAVVIREGVTNVLRHSRAKHCDIVLRQVDGQVRLAITNDGVGPDTDCPQPGGVRGSGVRNLSERVAALGGELECGPHPLGRYRLSVNLPL